MTFLGIDPGKKGSIAIIDSDRTMIKLVPVPVIKIKKGHDYDIAEMKHMLSEITTLNEVGICVIEKAQAMPGQGVTSMFTIGKGYGIWLGLLTAIGIPFIEISPRVWTRRLLIGVGGEGKERNYKASRQLFPEWQVKFKYEHEWCDSLLLAEYARLTYGR